MYFKLEHVTDYFLSRPEEMVSFPATGPDGISLTLRSAHEGDWSFEPSRSIALCIAETQRFPDATVITALGDLEERKLPTDHNVPPDEMDRLDSELHVVEPWSVEWSWLPDWLKDYLHAIRQELWAAALRLSRIARWYSAIAGSHSASGKGSKSFWSHDGLEWRQFPSGITGRVLQLHGLRTSIRDRETLSALLADPDATEPLGQELFREAWNQLSANPRSALIVGVAAAEAGIKEFISRLEPGAEWLTDNAPSPPLVDMLAKYLPFLLERHNIQVPAQKPPKAVLVKIGEAVTLRNKIGHGVRRPIDQHMVEEYLRAIQDVLWMLDYFLGNDWARRHVRQETQSVWRPATHQIT